MPPLVISQRTNAVEQPALEGFSQAHRAEPETETLFERAAWVYAFCRQHLFRDDTERIIATLWPKGTPPAGLQLIELGCGPGFYACRLAQRFGDIFVTGVDQSENQLRRAREQARTLALRNCSFTRINALDLSNQAARFEVVIASRLFTVLFERECLVAEIHRILEPGGRAFIAEPRYAFWASAPLFAMWILASLLRGRNGYREPHRAIVLSTQAFRNLFSTQPWKRVDVWRDGRYQYALCEK